MFIFYKNAWAKGVPVTAEERQAYLDAPTRNAQIAMIELASRDRPLTERRAYHKGLLATARYMPAQYLALFGGGGVVIAFVEGSPFWTALGIFSAAFAALSLLVKFTKQPDNQPS